MKLAHAIAEFNTLDDLVGRKKNLFVGSQTGGRAAAIACTLFEFAKLIRPVPQAWRAYTLSRIPYYQIRHSRVTSATTLTTRKRWPLANWSWTKTRDQRALSGASTKIGLQCRRRTRSALVAFGTENRTRPRRDQCAQPFSPSPFLKVGKFDAIS